MYLDQLFPGFKLSSSGVFRIIRDSELELDEEAEDLVRTFQSALKRRRRGSVVRLTIDDQMSEDLKEFIIDQLDVFHHDVFRFKYLGLSDYQESHAGTDPGDLRELVDSAESAQFEALSHDGARANGADARESQQLAGVGRVDRQSGSAVRTG